MTNRVKVAVTGLSFAALLVLLIAFGLPAWAVAVIMASQLVVVGLATGRV